MYIHNVMPTETPKQIAELYTVSEDSIRRINNLCDLSPAPGEELLILIPTRTYKIQYGDTLEKISLRFGIRSSDISAMNPHIQDDFRIDDEITLRYADRPLGMAVANGYFYKGCTADALRRALPYTTYITFASVIATERGLTRIFDDRDEVKLIKKKSKIPLVRIHDRKQNRFRKGANNKKYAEDLINVATAGGYKGIVLDACSQKDSAEDFTAFIVELRKMMIGCDLILITEINESSPIEFSEYADSSIIYYPKYALNSPPSFKDGEQRIISDFACNGESAKAFIDLPSLASRSGNILCIDEALNKARANHCVIEHNKSTLLSHFGDKKQGEYSFISLSGLRKIYELIDEFDYMGICFDIMRTPLSHIMMYNSLFKTSYHTSVRSREGCSRAVEE